MEDIYWFLGSFAQCLAAFTAFIVAGYSILRNYFDFLSTKDESIKLVNDELESIHFYWLKCVLFASGFCIMLNLLFLITSDTTTNNDNLYGPAYSISSIIFKVFIFNVVVLFINILFVLSVLDPKNKYVAAEDAYNKRLNKPVKSKSNIEYDDYMNYFRDFTDKLNKYIYNVYSKTLGYFKDLGLEPLREAIQLIKNDHDVTEIEYNILSNVITNNMLINAVMIDRNIDSQIIDELNKAISLIKELQEVYDKQGKVELDNIEWDPTLTNIYSIYDNKILTFHDFGICWSKRKINSHFDIEFKISGIHKIRDKYPDFRLYISKSCRSMHGIIVIVPWSLDEIAPDKKYECHVDFFDSGLHETPTDPKQHEGHVRIRQETIGDVSDKPLDEYTVRVKTTAEYLLVESSLITEHKSEFNINMNEFEKYGYVDEILTHIGIGFHSMRAKAELLHLFTL